MFTFIILRFLMLSSAAISPDVAAIRRLMPHVDAAAFHAAAPCPPLMPARRVYRLPAFALRHYFIDADVFITPRREPLYTCCFSFLLFFRRFIFATPFRRRLPFSLAFAAAA